MRGNLSTGITTLIFSAITASSLFAQSVEISFQGGPATVVDLSAAMLPNGDLKYAGSQVIEETQSGGPTLAHTVSWDFTVKGSNVGDYNEALYNGKVTIQSDAATPGARDFTVRVSVPMLAIYENIYLKGSGSLKLVANAGGGQINCVSDPSTDCVLAFMADEQVGAYLVYCPFNMSTTGAGSATLTLNNLQNYMQQQAIPSAFATTGLKLQAKVTSGDKVVASLLPVFAKPPCDGDFNFDKIVNGSDIGYFLGKWLQTENIVNCDFSHDGIVDQEDLGLFLGMIGPCE